MLFWCCWLIPDWSYRLHLRRHCFLCAVLYCQACCTCMIMCTYINRGRWMLGGMQYPGCTSFWPQFIPCFRCKCRGNDCVYINRDMHRMQDGQGVLFFWTTYWDMEIMHPRVVWGRGVDLRHIDYAMVWGKVGWVNEWGELQVTTTIHRVLKSWKLNTEVPGAAKSWVLDRRI